MTYEEVLSTLRPAIKDSHLEGQRRVDLSCLPASRRREAEIALAWARAYVARGTVPQERLKKDLGIE